ncbi:hypothetical protein TNCV_4499971 [Trichonephila clavipes]|nr:hypothetical protein TNCV_4499971 [Trichonephila clavipes]
MVKGQNNRKYNSTGLSKLNFRYSEESGGRSTGSKKKIFGQQTLQMMRSRFLPTANQRAPLIVQSLELSSCRQGDGALSGVEVIHFSQLPIRTLTLATCWEEQVFSLIKPRNTITNSCYLIGRSDKPSPAPIG